jgi:Holliday junction resolvase RusA-like endonuclease
MQPTTVSFIVPLTPPSVNHYVRHVWRGTHVRHYITDEAQGFITAVQIMANGKLLPVGKYGVRLRIFLGKGERGDIDNFPKCVLDALKGHIIHSDGAVKHLEVDVDRDADKPRTEIEVWML